MKIDKITGSMMGIMGGFAEGVNAAKKIYREEIQREEREYKALEKYEFRYHNDTELAGFQFNLYTLLQREMSRGKAERLSNAVYKAMSQLRQ